MKGQDLDVFKQGVGMQGTIYIVKRTHEIRQYSSLILTYSFVVLTA